MDPCQLFTCYDHHVIIHTYPDISFASERVTNPSQWFQNRLMSYRVILRKKATEITARVNEWRRRGWDVTRTPTRWRALQLSHTERPAVTLSPKAKCHGECTPSNQNEIFLLLLRGRSTQALTRAHPPAAAFRVTLLPRPVAVVPPNLLMHANTAAILLYPKVDHRIQRDSSVGREKKFYSICTFDSITDTVGILKKCLWSKQQTFYTVWAVNGCFPLFFSCSFEACSRAFSRLLWNSTSAAVHIVSPLLFSPCFWAK